MKRQGGGRVWEERRGGGGAWRGSWRGGEIRENGGGVREEVGDNSGVGGGRA